MRTRRSLSLLPVAAAMLLLLAACSPSQPTGTSATASAGSSGTPQSTAVPGTPFTADTFTTVIPPGWDNDVTNPTEVAKFQSSGAVKYLIKQAPSAVGTPAAQVNDVTANINVVVVSQPVPNDKIVAYLQSVQSAGATNLSQPQQFTVDGTTGTYITYNRQIFDQNGQNPTPGESQDMVVNHGGQTYDIVLNTSAFAFPAQQQGLQDILAAWKWTS